MIPSRKACVIRLLHLGNGHSIAKLRTAYEYDFYKGMLQCSSQSRYVDSRPLNHTSGQKVCSPIMSEVPSVACRYPSKASQYHLGTELRSRSRGLRTFTKFSSETFDDEVRAYGNVERDECRQARSEDSDERHRCGEDGSCPNVPGYRCEHSLFWLRAECVRSRT